jgi:hypothetical protein
MACNTETLRTIDARCDRSVGGLKRILLAQRDDIETPELNEDKEITNIVLKSGKKFEQFRFRPNTASLTSTFSSDVATGNVAFTTEISLQFSKAEAQKRLAIQSAINAAAVVIAEDMFGQYIFLGYDMEVTVTAATMVTGTATSDLNGFTMVLTDVAQEMPHFVAADFDVDGLLIGANQ